MAKHNTLTELFTDIANAIRNKTRKSDTIVADDFPMEVDNMVVGFDYVNDLVTTIPDSAFKDCIEINSVRALNVTSIGANAFENCVNLESVILYIDLATIGANCFKGCTNLTIYCEASEKPEGWYDNWNPDNCPVVYGYNPTIKTWDISDTGSDSVIATLYRKAGSDSYSLDISGTGRMQSYSPGYPDYKESPWYDYNITSVTINDGVANIGESAFYGCSKLEYITIPASVTRIGKDAFQNCGYDIEGDHGVVYISDIVAWNNISFANAGNTSTSIPTNRGYELYLDGKLLTDLVIPEGVTRIGSGFISTSITSVTIPSTITEISWNAFSGCGKLNAVYITDLAAWCNVTFLAGGYYTNPLNYANNLYLNGELVTNLVIPNDVAHINSMVFEDCTSITSVIIPNTSSVCTIGSDAFNNTAIANGTGYIYVPASMVDAYKAASNWSAYAEQFRPIEDLVIEAWDISATENDNVTAELRYDANDTSLYTLNIAGTGNMSNYSSSTIPWKEFSSNIASVNIGDNVTNIGDRIFYGCSSLTSITIPDAATRIGNGAFYNCKSLTSINIPSSVTMIDAYAFEYCKNLTAVHITDMIAWCGIRFEHPNMEGSGQYPGTNPLYYAGKLYLNGELVTDLVIPDGVTRISATAFEYCKSLISVTIPDSVTTIYEGAFQYCANLISIAIPNSVRWIDYCAFSGCASLTSINIPDSVQTLRSRAFSGCTSLTSITIPDGVTSIDDSVFSCCESLTSIIIPDGIRSIGDRAFNMCESLTFVVIPDSVTKIKEGAFMECTNLTSIYIPASVSTVYGHVFYGCSKLTIYCEATEKPNGWYEEWNLTNCPVVWGYHPNTIETWDISMTEDIDETDKVIATLCTDTNNSGSYTLYIDGIGSITDTYSSTTIPWGDYSSRITDVRISDGIDSIGKSLFYRCTGLTTITIPDTVISIKDAAFQECTGLISVTIPDSVTNIYRSAFYKCTNLSTVIIPRTESICNIRLYVFDDTAIANGTGYIYVPASMVDAYIANSNWSAYASQIRAIEDYPEILVS